jgi:uncharacterized membrane protein
MTNHQQPPKPVTIRSSGAQRLRRYFFTGLVITAPAAITVWATVWFISVFDGIIKPWIPAIYNPDSYLPIKVPGFGLVVALLGITLVGALAANILGRTLINLWDRLINGTPIVRTIYKSSKQIFETIFSEQGASFRQVCMVEWPRKDCWSIGFVSREVDGEELGLAKGRAMYAVYVSTTPNPTSGYVFFVDQASVKILSMTVEDGLKLVISMGLIFPEKPLEPEQELLVAKPVKKTSRKTKA